MMLGSTLLRSCSEMTSSFTESTVEDAALAWLESLGYVVKHGPGGLRRESCLLNGKTAERLCRRTESGS